MNLGIIASEKDQDAVVEFLFPYGLDRSIVLFPNRPETDNFCGTRMQIQDGKIHVLPDWFNLRYPLAFPDDIPFNKGNLIALTLYFNGLYEDAVHMSKDLPMGDFIRNICENPGDLDWISTIKNTFIRDYNLAVALSYFGMSLPGSSTESVFESALEQAPNIEMKALTSYHYAIYLQDKGQTEIAKNILFSVLHADPETAAETIIKLEYSRCLSTLNEITKKQYKAVMTEALSYYKLSSATLPKAQILQEMCSICIEESNFQEALACINEAISIYTKEDQKELRAQSLVTKGSLLHAWAKQNMPQFYQDAIKAYQEALKVFRKDVVPHMFAELHHQLAILYAEMPSTIQKKSIWAAVSATSFKEALSYYTREDYPLEYASICHNYGTALIFYPEAKTTDNIEHAIHYFREALEIRTADYPRERASTLINYLEACWDASNVNDTMEEVRIKEMITLSRELKGLASNPEMVEIADKHLENITKLQHQRS